MKKSAFALAAVVLVMLSACNRLSSEAKKMVGNYYIFEVSADEPVMELKKNGTVIQRAIKPGVLTYCVKGKWNVKNDTLIIKNDPVPFDIEGDSTLIGKIPERMAKAVVGFNGVTLTLRSEGTDYIYYRRGDKKD